MPGVVFAALRTRAFWKNPLGPHLPHFHALFWLATSLFIYFISVLGQKFNK